MPKLQIKKISIQNVNTKYGNKEKYGVLFESDKGEFWADAWKNQDSDSYVGAWSEGQEVDVELQRSKYNPKYWNIVVPKGGGSKQILDALSRIEAKLDTLLNSQSDLPPAPYQGDYDHDDAAIHALQEDEEGDVPF